MQNIVYTDQTKKIPVVSSQGNRYIIVLYEWDGNLILIEPMKTWAWGKCAGYTTNWWCDWLSGASKSQNTSSTMKPQVNIYRQSNTIEYNMNKHPQTFTEKTSQKKQSACSRTTSKQFLQHALMGPIVTTSWKHIKHDRSNKHSTNNICLCIHE